MSPALASPAAMVIFGLNGDLASRKLLPALYNLRKSGLLSDHFAILGNGRGEVSIDDLRERMSKALQEQIPPERFDREIGDWLVNRIEYVAGDSKKIETYQAIEKRLSDLETRYGTAGNAMFYMATPPDLFSVIPGMLHEAGLLNEEKDPARDNGKNPQRKWRRLVIEKPFGRDLESAQALNASLKQAVSEEQIYRIDHYLGKETVQNMMVLRFANAIYEPIWNRRYIESVQITVAESLGVEGRGDYYDTSGALRDMVPNHLFQLVALVGMEPPNSFHADDVRDEKVKVLRAIRPFSEDDVKNRVVRGQYAGYPKEKNVNPDTTTETFVALRLEIDNWRWAGVPFYLRTGKKMASRQTEIVIQFRCPPFQMFRDSEAGEMNSNLIVFHVQPQERIQTHLIAKAPGPGVRTGEVIMDFDYEKSFGRAPETGYETLLFDVMNGDATLFQRTDQIETGWSVVKPIQKYWESQVHRGLSRYAEGSWGPREAEDLLTRDGHEWLATEKPDDFRVSRIAS